MSEYRKLMSTSEGTLAVGRALAEVEASEALVAAAECIGLTIGMREKRIAELARVHSLRVREVLQHTTGRSGQAPTIGDLGQMLAGMGHRMCITIEPLTDADA